MANADKYRLAQAFRELRLSLGYATAEAGYRAQTGLTWDQYINRENGRTEWALTEAVAIALDWGIPPTDLIGRWLECYEQATFLPLAEITGLTIAETRRRFERRRVTSGLSFEQLYLLVKQGQTGL